MSSKVYDIVIVGGGAAGLAAAVAAAQAGVADGHPLRVAVLERGERVGAKILRTGNGRCNLTNAALFEPLPAGTDTAGTADATGTANAAGTADATNATGTADATYLGGVYNDPAFVGSAFAAMPPVEVVRFFNGLGLEMVPDDEGRVYPVTDSAASVLDVLRFACRDLGVELICKATLTDFDRHEQGFELYYIDTPDKKDAREGRGAGAGADGSTVNIIRARRLILATGGLLDNRPGKDLRSTLYARTGSRLNAADPVLCPLATDTKAIRGLSGIRVKCRVKVCDSEGTVRFDEPGELLFRDYGVSGVVVFDASRCAGPGDTLSIDLLPLCADGELPAALWKRRAEWPERPAQELFTGLLRPKLGEAVLRRCGVGLTAPCGGLSNETLEKLADTAHDFALTVEGPAEPKQAQVTHGGLCTDAFDPRTLETHDCPGLYAAGELLDIDGRCGGFNLHWAWTSGLIAGRAAAAARLIEAQAQTRTK